MFGVNGKTWDLRLVAPHSDTLRRSDGSISLAVTDNNVSTVFINNRLRGGMLDRVICHELVHVFSFSYNLFIDIDTEELIADFLATYGRDIFAVADDIIGRFVKIA